MDCSESESNLSLKLADGLRGFRVGDAADDEFRTAARGEEAEVALRKDATEDGSADDLWLWRSGRALKTE